MPKPALSPTSYIMDTFVDPSDDAALARLFNYPLTSNQLIPSDLKKTYTKLYNAHVGAFAEQVEARKELERVKAGNKELRKRIGRTVDKTEQLLVVLQELKDEEVVEIREMETEEQVGGSTSQVGDEDPAEGVDRIEEKVPAQKDAIPTGKELAIHEPVSVATPSHSPATAETEPAPLRHKTQSSLPPPPARQKTTYCHCTCNCWDSDAAVNCVCRIAHEPCDIEKCHQPPKGVWLTWENEDGSPVDCGWTGAREEEEERFGYPANRLEK